MAEYKVDLHVHTDETSPCGMVGAEKLVSMYKRKGYQMLVITDHYYHPFFTKYQKESWEEKIDKYLTGFKRAREKGEEIGLKVLLGMEITFMENNNDYLIFGIDENMLREIPELYKYGMEKFYKMMKNEDIMIFQAHPYRKDNQPAAVGFLDGLEVYNGNPRHNSQNDKAYTFAEDHDLKMISGSDFHQVEDLARGGIITAEKIYDNKELMECLESGDYRLIKKD